MPLYYEVAKNFNSIESGIAIFPFTFTTAPAAIAVGLVITKTGKYRPSIWVGWILTTVGLGLLIILEQDTTTTQWIFLSLAAGLGTGILYSAQSFAVQASALNSDLQYAAAMYSFFRSLGQTFGVACGGAIFQNTFKHQLFLDPILRPESTQWARDASAIVQIVKSLPDGNKIKGEIVAAYVDSFRIEYHKIPVKRRQLQRKLKEHTKKGRRYLCVFIKKVITAKNPEDRTVYGNEHLYNELFGFWDHIVFTDEAHIDPTAQSKGRVLREQGTRDKLENMEERPPFKGIRFHIAVWISWWGKAEKLRFYNDEEDKLEQPPMPPNPRRRPTTKTEEEYRHRLVEWEAPKPHARDIKVQDNSMAQKYYIENLIPVYVDAIEKMR
ncbi:hypothetical protein ACMFMG_012000 [Clarireedia jacksonii]